MNLSKQVVEISEITFHRNPIAVARDRADKIVKIVSEMSFKNNNSSLSYVVNKLELAAQFKQ